MSIKKLWKSFWNWLKAELVEEVSDMVDIDGNLPDYGGTIECGEADADDVPFVSLLWDYGGFCGSGAALADGVTIADLRVSASGMSYSYAAGDLRKLSPGNSHENPDCLACLFVRGKDGAWRGGKFDWISSDRTKRDFSNIRTGYNGWPPVSIDAAEAYAFVIVSKDGCSRTNVCAQIEK